MGERSERELPLLPLEETLAEFRAGTPHLSRSARPGAARLWSPALWAVAATAADPVALRIHWRPACDARRWRFATASQAKVRWEGIDYSAIDALVRLPMDANRADTFLACRVRWANRWTVTTWPRSSSRIGHRKPTRSTATCGAWRAYGAVLGKFVTLEEYFTNTASPGELIKFKADGYRAPYLRQAASQNESQPISSIVDQHSRQALRYTVEALDAMTVCIGGAIPGRHDESCNEGAAELEHATNDAATRLASVLAPPDTAATGLLVVNPHSFAWRALVDVTALDGLPAVEGPVVAAQESAGRRFVVADVPGTGFCWLAPGAQLAPGKKKRSGADRIRHDAGQ